MGVKGKFENVKREMLRNGLAVLGVSEVRWKGNGNFESDEFRVIFSGGKERQKRGCNHSGQKMRQGG